jgi:hypothetical protein
LDTTPPAFTLATYVHLLPDDLPAAFARPDAPQSSGAELECLVCGRRVAGVAEVATTAEIVDGDRRNSLVSIIEIPHLVSVGLA